MRGCGGGELLLMSCSSLPQELHGQTSTEKFKATHEVRPGAGAGVGVLILGRGRTDSSMAVMGHGGGRLQIRSRDQGSRVGTC